MSCLTSIGAQVFLAQILLGLTDSVGFWIMIGVISGSDSSGPDKIPFLVQQTVGEPIGPAYSVENITGAFR